MIYKLIFLSSKKTNILSIFSHGIHLNKKNKAMSKKNMIVALFMLPILTLQGCNKKIEVVEDIPTIQLTSMSDTNIDLSNNNEILFSWFVTGKIEGGCTLLVGLDKNLTNSTPFIATGNSYKMDNEILDATLEINGINPLEEKLIYWSVVPTSQKEKALIKMPLPLSIEVKRMNSEITHTGPKAVFMGNSITELWGKRPFFGQNGYIGKGIGGQVTVQMLQRFEKDVIDLDPYCVVIMGGTNDLAHNDQYAPTVQGIMNNIIAMAEMAKSHRIKVLLCSVTPANSYPWNKEVGNPSSNIIYLNQLIKNYANQNGMTYVDYHSLLKADDNGLKLEYMAGGVDPVHLSSEAYDIIEPVIQNAIEKVVP